MSISLRIGNEVYRRVTDDDEAEVTTHKTGAFDKKEMHEGVHFWILQGHAEDELHTVEHSWSYGYSLKAEPTGRETTLLHQGEFLRIIEYSLVGKFEE